MPLQIVYDVKCCTVHTTSVLNPYSDVTLVTQHVVSSALNWLSEDKNVIKFPVDYCPMCFFVFFSRGGCLLSTAASLLAKPSSLVAIFLEPHYQQRLFNVGVFCFTIMTGEYFNITLFTFIKIWHILQFCSCLSFFYLQLHNLWQQTQANIGPTSQCEETREASDKYYQILHVVYDILVYCYNCLI